MTACLGNRRLPQSASRESRRTWIPLFVAKADTISGNIVPGWSDVEDYVFKPKKGLNEAIIREMSMKKEPAWMLSLPGSRPMSAFSVSRCPTWGGGGSFNDIDF